MFDEGAGVQFGYCLGWLFLRVHDNRAVPRDWLLDGLARNQQETNSFYAGLHHDLISAVKEHQRMIADVVDWRSIWFCHIVREHGSRLRGVPERARASEHVRKGVARGLDLEPLANSGWHRNVEVIGIGCDAFHRPSLA